MLFAGRKLQCQREGVREKAWANVTFLRRWKRNSQSGLEERKIESMEGEQQTERETEAEAVMEDL